MMKNKTWLILKMPVLCFLLACCVCACERSYLDPPDQNPYSNPNDRSSTGIQLSIARMDYDGSTMDSFVAVRNQNGRLIDQLNSGNFCAGITGMLGGSSIPVTAWQIGDNETLIGAMVLIMDYSCSMYPAEDPTGSIAKMELAAHRYVAIKRPTDYMEIIKVSWMYDVSMGLTQDNAALSNTINQTWPHECGIEGIPGTVLFDAVMQAINDLINIRAMPVIVLMTDGLDKTNHTAEEITAAAQQHGIPFFIIGLSWDDKELLQYLASETGGDYIYWPDPNQIDSMALNTRDYIKKSYFLRWEPEEKQIPDTATVCAQYQAAAGLLMNCQMSPVLDVSGWSMH